MVISLDSPLVASATRQDLINAWQQITPTSCPLSYNFHLHTLCSDGSLYPTEILDQARQLGLQGFTITDHHSVEGYDILRPYLRPGDPQLWTGVEITADLLGVEVHILGYAFDPDHSALQPYLQGITVREARAASVIHALHAAGGLVVLAHPFRYGYSGEELIGAAVQLDIDGIEAYYAYKNSSPWEPTPDRTAEAERLALEYRLHKTAGTDTHGLDITRRI